MNPNTITMCYLRTSVLSHGQKVCRLYKEALRNLQSYYHYRHIYRYHAVLLRARFDSHKDEKDMRVAKQLLLDGEKELKAKAHPQRLRFANSPGGSAYGREPIAPDWLLDLWHPLERAQYPEYFKRREQRKLEYISRWEKQNPTEKQNPA